MSEKEIASDSELYKDLVEILSSGNFLQLNGKAINLTELNDYVNAQNQEIERLNNIIKEVREYIKYQLENLDFEKDIKAKMLGAMVLVMLDKENK